MKGIALLVSLLIVSHAEAAETAKATDYNLTADIVVSGLDHPWSVAFLPDGDMLVTERSGNLRLIHAGKLSNAPVSGVPTVFAEGQGGLLDIILDPDFAGNNLIYFSYAEPGPDDTAGTAVARARLVRDGAAAGLEDVSVIFRQEPKFSGGNHFGSRLVVDRQGHLYVTLGERFRRDLAQGLDNLQGKVARIERDGSIPADNPFVGQAGARPEIWSYGHRNQQSAALNPRTGELWTVEHGARGGDEVNIPKSGRNYGWPVITYGIDYSGAKIGVGTAASGMEQPIHYWDPSIAPSGATFYTGSLFPKWQGDLFVGALKDQMIVRLDVEGDRITSEERLFEGTFGRVRDIRTGPDGALWVLTDESDGALIRIRPEQTTGAVE
jgi:glucose/arabinose dehydrogenase